MRYYKVTLSRNHRCQAFSLIELVMVIAIIGVMAAIAVPRFANASIRSRIDAAANRIVADLELAQKYAMHTSTPQTVTFGDYGYEIPGMRDPDHSTSSYNVDLSAEPYRAQITSVNLGGDSQIIFDIYGNADSGGLVSIKIARMVRKVRINPTTGRIRVE